jgi:hypothetical protein
MYFARVKKKTCPGNSYITCSGGEYIVCFSNKVFEFILTYLQTYFMEQTPSWTLTVCQLVKKFSAFYGTRRFITAFTNAHQLSVSWASSIQSIPPHPTSGRSILILSSHLRLGLPSALFPSVVPTNTLYRPILCPYALHAPPISFFSISSLKFMLNWFFF